MSQENVETVKAAYVAWNTGDMDTYRELHDPDVIARAPKDWPEPGPFVGREEVMREWDQLREWASASQTIEPISDFIDVADHVVVRQIWRGAGHRPETDMEITNVFTLRRGRIFYQEFFWDHAEALEAAGLAESAMSQENVEIVRRAFEAFNQDGVEEALPRFAPGIVVHALPEWPGPSEYRGHDGIRALMTEWTENFDDFEIEVGEIREVRDRVLVLGENVGRIKGSRVPIRQPFGALFGDFRNDQIGETRLSLTWREALEAPGLGE